MKTSLFGFNKADVEKCIDSIKQDYENMISDLVNRVTDLEEQVVRKEAEFDALKKESEISATTIIAAQKEAQAIKQQAEDAAKLIKEDAENIKKQAEENAKAIKNEAQAVKTAAEVEARQVRIDARAEADSVVAKAQEEADKIVANAKEIAGKIADYSKQGADLIKNVSQDLEDISREIENKPCEERIELPGAFSIESFLNVCNKDNVVAPVEEASDILEETVEVAKEVEAVVENKKGLIEEIFDGIAKVEFKPTSVTSIATDKVEKILKAMPKKYELNNKAQKSDYFASSLGIDNILDAILNKKEEIKTVKPVIQKVCQCAKETVKDTGYLDDLLTSLHGAVKEIKEEDTVNEVATEIAEKVVETVKSTRIDDILDSVLNKKADKPTAKVVKVVETVKKSNIDDILESVLNRGVKEEKQTLDVCEKAKSYIDDILDSLR